jgi:hypothetical protein
MLRKVSRLFVIKTRVEAFLIIYALALGATSRGAHYLTEYPGWGGKALFLACLVAVLLAGAKILDCLGFERREREAKAARSSQVRDGNA